MCVSFINVLPLLGSGVCLRLSTLFLFLQVSGGALHAPKHLYTPWALGVKEVPSPSNLMLLPRLWGYVPGLTKTQEGPSGQAARISSLLAVSTAPHIGEEETPSWYLCSYFRKVTPEQVRTRVWGFLEQLAV